MKRCSKCKKRKAESEFGKNARSRDGLRSRCKECERKYSRQRYRQERKSARRYYSYEESHRVVGSVKQTRCCRCNRWKAESEFGENAGNKDGLRSRCRACERKYSRLRYLKNRKSARRYYGYKESHRVVGSVKQRRCRRCNKWKAESEFYKQRKHKDGLSNWCKECADKATNDSRRRRRLAVRK